MGRNLRLWALAGTLALVASACTTGRSSSTSGRSPKPSFTGGTLVIWTDEAHASALPVLADRFTAQNPGVTIRVEQVPLAQMLQQVLRAIPAGQGPDLFIGADAWVGQLVAGRVVAPVDLGARKNGFLPVSVQAFTAGGDLYGVPYAVQTLALVRNTDLVPRPPSTWEEVRRVALRLKKAHRVNLAVAVQAPDAFFEYPLFSALGGFLFRQNPDGTYNTKSVGIDSPGGLAAADALAGWARQGLIPSTLTDAALIRSFDRRRVAFAITGPWALDQPPTGFRVAGAHFAVQPIPPVAGKPAKPLVGVQGMFVSALSKSPLLAQAFARDLLTTEQTQLTLARASGRPPALSRALDSLTDTDLKAFGVAAEGGLPVPSFPQMSAVWPAWAQAYATVLSGKGNPRKAFRDAAKRIRALISGA